MRSLFQHLQGMKARTTATGRHLAATIRGPVLWLTLCAGLLVAAIFVGTIMMAGEFRERALVNSERELENTVLLLARHFGCKSPASPRRRNFGNMSEVPKRTRS